MTTIAGETETSHPTEELLEQIFAPIDEIQFNRDIRDLAASGPDAAP